MYILINISQMLMFLQFCYRTDCTFESHLYQLCFFFFFCCAVCLYQSAHCHTEFLDRMFPMPFTPVPQQLYRLHNCHHQQVLCIICYICLIYIYIPKNNRFPLASLFLSKTHLVSTDITSMQCYYLNFQLCYYFFI